MVSKRKIWERRDKPATDFSTIYHAVEQQRPSCREWKERIKRIFTA